MSINLEQQIKCVRRELALRKNVYPQWVARGKKKKDDAEHEIEAMQAVHDTLVAVQAREAAMIDGGGLPDRQQPPPPPPPQGETDMFGRAVS